MPGSHFTGLGGDGRRVAQALAQAKAECEMAVVALVERFDEAITGSAKGGCNLGVRYPPLAGYIDRPAAQMIAVGDAADAPVMLDASLHTRHPAELRTDLGGGRQCGGRSQRAAPGNERGIVPALPDDRRDHFRAKGTDSEIGRRISARRRRRARRTGCNQECHTGNRTHHAQEPPSS